MSNAATHPFPHGQTYLSEEEKAELRAELARNNEAARAARSAQPRGLNPRVRALRGES